MSTGGPQSASSHPAVRLMRTLWPGAMAVQAIHIAAKLGVADLVAGGPKTVAELADATRTHGPSLGRLLRALTSLGIFAEDPEGRYGQSGFRDAPPEIFRRSSAWSTSAEAVAHCSSES